MAIISFMRNMFHSLIQQLVRQDPVFYAMQVACRADHNTDLICYPYMAKCAGNSEEKTGFLHTDVNLGRLFVMELATARLQAVCLLTMRL
jgi:hypothetical protein